MTQLQFLQRVLNPSGMLLITSNKTADQQAPGSEERPSAHAVRSPEVGGPSWHRCRRMGVSTRLPGYLLCHPQHTAVHAKPVTSWSQDATMFQVSHHHTSCLRWRQEVGEGAERSFPYMPLSCICRKIKVFPGSPISRLALCLAGHSWVVCQVLGQTWDYSDWFGPGTMYLGGLKLWDCYPST